MCDKMKCVDGPSLSKPLRLPFVKFEVRRINRAYRRGGCDKDIMVASCSDGDPTTSLWYSSHLLSYDVAMPSVLEVARLQCGALVEPGAIEVYELLLASLIDYEPRWRHVVERLTAAVVCSKLQVTVRTRNDLTKEEKSSVCEQLVVFSEATRPTVGEHERPNFKDRSIPRIATHGRGQTCTCRSVTPNIDGSRCDLRTRTQHLRLAKPRITHKKDMRVTAN
mmetsp:Transcript_15241/g.49649  ORF Transcript_15241/g.49649 Transcript_15241/m.49649 type:complete len:222 (-) Transcript_15241:1481-2146(-)